MKIKIKEKFDRVHVTISVRYIQKYDDVVVFGWQDVMEMFKKKGYKISEGTYKGDIVTNRHPQKLKTKFIFKFENKKNFLDILKDRIKKLKKSEEQYGQTSEKGRS